MASDPSPSPEENAVRTFVTDSAGWGARLATSKALDFAQTGPGVTRVSDPDPPKPVIERQYADALVGGAIPVDRAAEAAIKGAKAGIVFLEPRLRPDSWPRLTGFEFIEYKLMLQKLEVAASSAAISAVYSLAALHARIKEENSVDELVLLDVNLTALMVSITVRQACLGAFTEMQAPAANVNRWSGLLVPILAACLPTASAAYPHLLNKPHWTVFVFCSILLVLIITLMVGVAAVAPFHRKCNPEAISRHATFLSFFWIIVLGTLVVCTLLPTWPLRAGAVAIGLVALAILVVLWLYSGQRTIR